MDNNFTFNEYKNIFQQALDNDYRIITLKEFFNDEYDPSELILVNRIDVDIKIERLKYFYEIFKDLNIKSSVYVRLHAPQYNLLSINNIKIIQDLLSIGCEIGLHTEMEDLKGLCGINQESAIKTEIRLLEAIFNTKIHGTASHGDITGFNNLDFWKKFNPHSLGLNYEAYENKLWNNCRYVSDSEWTIWKAYHNGKLIENDRRSPIEHIKERVKILHLLTHPESWYERYIHE